MTRLAVPMTALSLVLACTACSRPAPPEKDRPVEPQANAQAQAPAQRPYGNPHALRDYMQTPIDKAKAVEGVTLDAAKQQQAAIDAQVRGDDPAAATSTP